jgi:phage tail-like protein
MPIQDFAYNPLALPASGQMLGFVEPVASEEELALRIYLFLIEGIRQEDQQNGALFVKRYLEGPQLIWGQIQGSIFGLKTLWDINEIADDYLVFLKHIVGWTSELDHITNALDADTLRRLIASSAALWKERGTEDALSNVVSLVVGARSRIWNWFDFRWITDETGLGHEHDGRDPWTISIDDNVTINFRIVDDGALNRQLVRDLANLMRPLNERVEITYLRFLDLFSVDDDNSQWIGAEGVNTTLDVASGVATLTADPGAGYAMAMVSPAVPVAGSPVWQNYVVTARIKGRGEWGLAFGIQASNPLDRYQVRFNFATGEILIDYVSGGSIIASLTSIGVVPVVEDMWYSVRVQYSPENAGTESRLILYVDGVELINFADDGAPYLSGAMGFIRVITGGECHVDEVEVLGLPAESDLVDINS